MAKANLHLLAIGLAAILLPSRLPGQAGQSRQSAIADTVTIADTVNDESDDRSSWRLRTGASAGTLRYEGGRTESAAAVLLKLALGEQLSMAVTPTFAHVSFPGSTGSAAGNISGLTDIPIGIGVQHSFGGRFDPDIGFSAAATIPVGDTAKGLGSGSIGSSFDVSAGFSLIPGMGVSAGVGHSFSDFSVRSALNGTAAGWGDVGVWGDVTDRLSLDAGYDRDIGSVDTVFGRSSSITAGMSYALFNQTNLAISAGRGLTGPSPLWSVSLGFGTAIPSIGGGFHNAVDQLTGAFGGGNHGLAKKGSGGGSGPKGSTHRGGRRKIGT